jgi:hypothetical protein
MIVIDVLCLQAILLSFFPFLFLQMPIREACHVAVQKNHPSKQKLWKHAQARHHADHEKLAPILEIVSNKQVNFVILAV